MRLPDESISFQNTTGDAGMENLYIYGKLNYNFENDDITSKSINAGSGQFNDISLNTINAGSGQFNDISLNTINATSHITTTATITALDLTATNNVSVGSSITTQNLTATNNVSVGSSVTAGSFYGDGSNLTGIEAFVKGMIILWYGDTNNVPNGFALCDGTNDTPDLRDKFVVGAGSAYTPGDTGGADSVTLTVDQIPPHTHTYIDQYVVINAGYRPWPANNNDCAARNINSGSAGGGQSHENRPPYHALCYIMKT